MSNKFLRLLAVVLAFSLVAAACGGDDEESVEPPPPAPAPTEAPPPESEPEPAPEPPPAPAPEPPPEPAPEPAAEEPGNIVEVAVGSGAFPTLVAAVVAAGLDGVLSGDGPFTVFAPTEEAFAAALDALGITAEQILADTDLLTAVLTYHVLPLEAPAEMVLTLDGQSVTTVNGADVTITIDDGAVMVNDATVVTADIAASNGVIHVIDTVLLPPAPEPEPEPEPEPAPEPAAEEPGNIVEVAVGSGAFPTLVAAVVAAGLDGVLSGDGPFTVFAPTEEAFAAALDALGITAEQILADTDLLTAVLTYHVLPLEAPAEMVLTLDGQSVTTVNGADVTITIDDGAVMVNDATVVTADIAASNGVIHVIDTVLLPPAG
ncbi:MAG: fasciclin domain-containing protein [bacterium]|nr:fasciclin domain-containing protein [bacterium]MDE0667712.1 fasciclin domain-containing protein [bacterium]